MARADIKKRIKDDVLIDERIQILRLHYEYLKAAMKHLDPTLLDRSKYKTWNLKVVESHSFNGWWSKIGKTILGRKLDAIKELSSTSKRRQNTILVEIPLDNPTEYSVDKIREIINSKGSKNSGAKTDERLHYVKLQIYLEAYLLRFTKNLTLSQIADELISKRKKILKQRGNRSAMDRTQTEKFLSSGSYESTQRQILRFRQKAGTILENVCKGEFPGEY
jgi:hypothetical protein|tara:strand:- start:257 stop:919 length:663 start_codon:yes stop_codon:yes gene_type:complete